MAIAYIEDQCRNVENGGGTRRGNWGNNGGAGSPHVLYPLKSSPVEKDTDMTDWQPIETAPRDGTFIFTGKKTEWIKAVDNFPYVLKTRWNGSKWEASDGRVYDPQPTHWMPEPEPPEG